MPTRALLILLARDLTRTRGPLVTAGFGIAVGVAALVFFLGLGLGARKVLLGDVFPIDQVELEPKRTSAGLLSLLGGPYEPEGVKPATIDALKKVDGVTDVYPKLRFRFPSTARGGKAVFGKDMATHEMVGDGIDPALVQGELPPGVTFDDPLNEAGPPCQSDADCSEGLYCEKPSKQKGQCSKPVPALVSRYLVEVFDHGVAPSHGLPPVAGTLVEQAKGVDFQMGLGSSVLGVAPQGEQRTVRLRVVGVSERAIDLGVTLPLAVVKRWNAEYAGAQAAQNYSSVVVKVSDPSVTSDVLEEGTKHGLAPTDTRARDVSVLISGVLALLVLVASVILLVGALNIAHTFRVLVSERTREIGLYRALGASAGDMRVWLLCLAVVVGVLGGLAGTVVARAGALVADWRAGIDLPDFPFKPDSFFVFPAWLWLLGIGFAVVFAILGAAIPANRAARTDPAAALGRPD